MKRLPIYTYLLLTLFGGAGVMRAQNGTKITHVLLISIDGMHSQDLTKWVQANPSSTLHRLTVTGTTYTDAYTTQPSDSIPSTVGIFSGASPSLGGMYYDDAWHRVWAPPASKGTCTVGVKAGTAIDLKQGIDKDGTRLDAGGGIDPNLLPRDPFNNCAPVYPHNMIRVNTIFEVVRAAGMYTAYSEKRPSYDFLNGPSGAGVQDLYTPEIAAVNLLDPTAIEGFDTLRVNSVLNEINGLNHDGTAAAPTPALFGMNFQAINSAKKSSPTSGYVDNVGAFDKTLSNEMAFVDRAIGSMISALERRGMINSTAVIITAKHGESPLGNTRTIVDQTLIGTLLKNAVPSISTNKTTQKTSELIWLKNQAQTPSAVSILNASPTLAPNLSSVLSFGSGLPFPNPLSDPAVPDLVVVMKDGVNFEPQPLPMPPTNAEHGGFGEFETHVPLLVSCPRLPHSTQTQKVLTRQIAPTVLALLGVNPQALIAVQVEGVAGLTDVLAKLH